jgi:hypothetical protein
VHTALETARIDWHAANASLRVARLALERLALLACALADRAQPALCDVCARDRDASRHRVG